MTILMHDQFMFQSFTNEFSLIKFWNFFADPEKSTRNLWLNVGFVSSKSNEHTALNTALYCYFQTAGSHIMAILPTFFGTVDLPAIRSDFPVLEDVPENEPLRLWNRLLCPQCILNTVLANTVVVRVKEF